MFLLAGADDARRAERALLRSLRKNADGAIAKYDRYVSLSISRWLMLLPITPNQVTFLAATLGVLCGVAAGHGGYGWMLAGALGFQLNSIFDGIDGEIARAKLLESHVGQWLDTIADDLSNLAFFVGTGIGSYRMYGWLGYLVLGVAAGVGQLMTSAVQYHYLLKVAHSGDLNDVILPWARYSVSQRPTGTSDGRGFVSKLQWVFRRDAFAAFSTMFAALGQLRVLTWAFALGGNIVWVLILGYHALHRRLAARRIEAV
jgi:CDP-L-myo-inositol myo-inositolphosphotransferase